MHLLRQVGAMEEIKVDHITQEEGTEGTVVEEVIVMGKMEEIDGVHVEDQIVGTEEAGMTEEDQVMGELIIFSSLNSTNINLIN